MRRAQFIIEFLVLLVFAVLAGVIYLTLAGHFASDAGDRQRLLAVDDLGYRLQDELLFATTVRDGYERTVQLPTRIGRFSYSVTCDNNSITVRSGTVERVYPTPEFAGSFGLGNNTIYKRGGIRVVNG